jgi:zinc protease
VRLQAWMAKDDAIISITAPANASSELPEDSALLALWYSSKTQVAQAYQPQQDVTTLMQQIPQPGAVINKAFNEQWNAHVWTLSNGVNVVLKESQYKENTLRFWARSNGGYSLVDDETFLKSFGMMSSIDSFGLGDLNVEQLNSYMQGKRFSVSARINTYTEELYGQTDLDSITEFFQTMHLRFVGARKDQSRFDWLKGLYQPQIEQRMNNPNYQFTWAISEATNSGNPRVAEFDVAALNNQNLDTIYDIRTRSFSNAADFDFVFVGDLDLGEMERYLTTYVATLPASESRDPINILPNYAQSDFVEVNVPIGKEAKATVIKRYSGKAQWTHKNSLVLNALRGSLENSLRVRLREELGGVYSVGVNGSMSRWPHQNYSFQVSFTCDPERIEELRSEVEQVFARYIAGDIDEQNLVNFKTQSLVGREKALKENGFWLGYIMGSLSPRLPLALEEFEATINSITVDDLKAAANIYLIKNAGYFATLTPEPVDAKSPVTKAPVAKAPSAEKPVITAPATKVPANE